MKVDQTAVTSKMNWDGIAGKWEEVKGSVKEKWAKLSDADLTTVNGRRDQLIGKIQERYGVAKEDADRQVATWLTTTHFDAKVPHPNPSKPEPTSSPARH